MLEHSIYTVISPEGCASILWKDTKYAEEAATSMKITAQDLKELNIIDSIILEPTGGAHRNPTRAIKNVGNAIRLVLKQVTSLDKNELLNQRKNKYLMTINQS
jgi:acetyl-CoA carboxylase carboxyl transferase subunit alpha